MLALVGVCRNEQTAQRSTLLVKRYLVPPLCGDAGRLHAGGSCADDEHPLLHFGGHNVVALRHAGAICDLKGGIHSAALGGLGREARSVTVQAAAAGCDLVAPTLGELVRHVKVGLNAAVDENEVDQPVTHGVVHQVGGEPWIG